MATVLRNRVCKVCGGDKFTRDLLVSSGDVSCTNCGAVMEENPIVSEVQFGESASGAAMVQGAMVGADQARANFNMRNAMESREQTLLNAKKKIKKIASVMRIPDYIVDSASGWFKLALVQNFVQGRRSQNVIAACLYVACRHEKTHHLLIDFSSRLQISVYSLGSTYLKLVRALQIQRLPIADPSLFIQHFADRLQFGDKTAKVCKDATKLAHRMSLDWIYEGRRPAGIAGACILIAARMNHINRSHAEIVAVARVGEETIQKRLNEFKKTTSGKLKISEFRDSEHLHDSVPPSFEKNRRIELKVREFLLKREKTLYRLKELAHQNRLAQELDLDFSKTAENTNESATNNEGTENADNNEDASNSEGTNIEGANSENSADSVDKTASKKSADSKDDVNKEADESRHYEELSSSEHQETQDTQKTQTPATPALQPETQEIEVPQETSDNRNTEEIQSTEEIDETQETQTENTDETRNTEETQEIQTQNTEETREINETQTQDTQEIPDREGEELEKQSQKTSEQDDSNNSDEEDLFVDPDFDYDDLPDNPHDETYRVRSSIIANGIRNARERKLRASTLLNREALDARLTRLDSINNLAPAEQTKKEYSLKVKKTDEERENSLLRAVLDGGSFNEEELEQTLDRFLRMNQQSLSQHAEQTSVSVDEMRNSQSDAIKERIEKNRPRNLVANNPTSADILKNVRDNEELDEEDDDADLDSILLLEEQREEKERIWIAINYDFLIAQEKKRLKMEADELTGNTSGQPRKRRKVKEQSVDAVVNDPAIADALKQIGEDGKAMTPADSAKQIFQKKAFSRKINYGSITELFNS